MPPSTTADVREMTPDRYDVRAHLRWLLTVPEFHAKWLELAAEDQARVKGRPRREVSVDDPDLGTGRGGGWRGGIRRLAGVLPAHARGLTRPMVQIEWLALPGWVDGLMIEGGRSLSTETRDDLQRLCRLSLSGPRLTNTEQKRLGRRLSAIDPLTVGMIADLNSAPELELGDRVRLGATQMACASIVWTDQSAADIGVLSLSRAGGLMIEPLSLGGERRGPKPARYGEGLEIVGFGRSERG